ncbi:flagellar hook-length control protein FliK [Paenibacillus sediminis]|uniref:Flagellar hook-length control protein FliK n=1 Tax=Paenibacillus sediminis TaxID=664909 RepID=A0ABS4H1L6_9BACL|nr:flagellar hook-length control protein FliK [Paenibacillus sediminis]MBP1936422.1 flagellar hook-length control protein FliK [Paenibacillus sediminis]
MSFTLPNVGTTSSAGSQTVSSAGKTAAAGGSAAPFNQTLTQIMGGNADGSSSDSVTSLSLLEGLQLLALLGGESKATDGKADGTAQDADALLVHMFSELQKLDDTVANDPSLLAALQGWLQQVNALLSSNGQGMDSSAEQASASTLTVLSENPTTVRFAVQDGLAQLVQMAQQGSVTTEEQTEIASLLQSFDNIMQKAVDQKGTSKVNGPVISNILQNANVQNAPVHTDQHQTVAAQNGSAASGLSVQQLNASQVHTQAAEGVQLAAGSDKSNDGSQLTETSGVKAENIGQSNIPQQHIITAGQLALSDTGTAPVKPATPQVHVQRFAQEMSGFVVNKLDIVKLNGISEATISLRPEHLGQVDVKITMHNGQLVAQFMTDNAAAKDMLEQQMSGLRATLHSQGIQVDKLEVTQNQSLSSQMYQDGRQPGNGQQQNRQTNKNRGEQSEDALTVLELSEEWNEWIRQSELGGIDDQELGGSFAAKA